MELKNVQFHKNVIYIKLYFIVWIDEKNFLAIEVYYMKIEDIGWKEFFRNWRYKYCNLQVIYYKN